MAQKNNTHTHILKKVRHMCIMFVVYVFVCVDSVWVMWTVSVWVESVMCQKKDGDQAEEIRA